MARSNLRLRAHAASSHARLPILPTFFDTARPPCTPTTSGVMDALGGFVVTSGPEADERADAFRDALPIAGVDGTLRNRMKGTAAAGNVRAKTGSLSSVASLSGYVTSAAGERLAFSMMLNNYPDASVVRKDSIDAIAVLLASFGGRSQ